MDIQRYFAIFRIESANLNNLKKKCEVALYLA